MITAEWNKSTLKSLEKKIEAIVKKLPEGAKNGITEALENTQQLAIQLKPQGKSNDGILVEMIDTEKNEIRGRVYTDVNKFPYLVYLEYGTGKYAGEADGRYPEAPPSIGSQAKSIPWFIHISMADMSVYGYKPVTIGDEQFYVVYGMHPSPYMRPAAFQERDNNVDAVRQAIYEVLKEVL